MCGIAGIWRFKDKASLQEIRRITDSLEHRGPDSGGYEVIENNNLALGHRRLCILDLSEAGKQPMYSHSARYIITYNGEVYNFIEIKKELEKEGVAFKTRTDTEVILEAYIKWGVRAFEKFNGMWAIAIWDSQERELFLCRDRFGVKPLYFLNLPGRLFAFGSETVAFRHIEGFERNFSEDHLLRQICNHNILEATPHTIYNNICQLQPGCILKINNRQELSHQRWWTGVKKVSVPRSFEEQCEIFTALFSDACKIRLRSDVPIGTALSGGLDSTAVFCMLNSIISESSKLERIPRDWQRSFSITFPGSKNDETRYIKEVLSFAGREGTLLTPDLSNLCDDIVKTTRLSDFISVTPLNCVTDVYKAMRQSGVVVSLDGHGADEYLYGYVDSVEEALLQSYLDGNGSYSEKLESTIREMAPDIASEIIANVRRRVSFIDNSLKGKLKRTVRSFIRPNNYYTLPEARSRFITRTIASMPLTSNPRIKHSDRGEARLAEQFSFTDIPYNLRDFDRGSMQHHIEIRMPFMDYRLVNFCFSLPPASKLNHGYTKYLMRQSLKSIMPPAILERKNKIGLTSPVSDWFNGPLNEFVRETLSSSSLVNYGWLDVAGLKKMAERNCKEKTWDPDSAKEIWPFINLALISV